MKTNNNKLKYAIRKLAVGVVSTLIALSINGGLIVEVHASNISKQLTVYKFDATKPDNYDSNTPKQVTVVLPDVTSLTYNERVALRDNINGTDKRNAIDKILKEFIIANYDVPERYKSSKTGADLVQLASEQDSDAKGGSDNWLNNPYKVEIKDDFLRIDSYTTDGTRVIANFNIPVELIQDKDKDPSSAADAPAPTVNKADLQAEVDKDGTTKASDKYKFASESKKNDYNTALTNANTVLNNADATQVEVDQAKDALVAAREGLDGVSVNKNDQNSSNNKDNTVDHQKNGVLPKTGTEIQSLFGVVAGLVIAGLSLIKNKE